MRISSFLFFIPLASLGCGARTGLPVDEAAGRGGFPDLEIQAGAGQGGTGQAGAGQGGAGQAGAGQGGAGQAGVGGMAPCADGATLSCGPDVGACKPGVRTCKDGEFGPCEGALGPTAEVCNSVDDDCDGVVDDGFNIGAPCKGNGSNQCLDGVITCNGCVKTGPEKVEVCNGVDDNCNGIIDADCEVGGCKPTLLVTGSTPSSPGCVDFPVEAGSTGVIAYPCGGGPVTATLNGIAFVGSVSNNFVVLDGDNIVPPEQSPDGCTWHMFHHIEGNIPSGLLSYSYSEVLVSGINCWSPCTEIGDVKINWIAAP